MQVAKKTWSQKARFSTRQTTLIVDGIKGVFRNGNVSLLSESGRKNVIKIEMVRRNQRLRTKN